MEEKSGSPAGGKRPARSGKDKAGAASFDVRLERLEALVVELEAGGLGLEKAIERYKEGVELLSGCRDLLLGYRQQVEELTRGAELSARPYPDDPDLAEA